MRILPELFFLLGLFGILPNIFKKPSITKVVKAVATGGVSLVAPKLIPKIIDKPLTTLIEKQWDPNTLLSVVGRTPATSFSTALVPQGVKPMALNIGGILGQVGTIFGGNQNPYFQGVSNVANLASQFFPTPGPSTQLAARPMVQSSLGMLPAIGRAGAVVGRSFFNRFPNLAVVIQGWRDRGVAMTRSKLWSLLKRFGPEILVSGGILTAAAVSELMVAGPGHRRMNAANSKALRRAARRIKSFHRLCGSIDLLKSRGRGRAIARSFCGTCRKNPCRC